MKRVKLFYTLIVYILLLSSCSSGAGGTTGKIISPDNKLMPITGKWEITRTLRGDFTELKGGDNEKWASKTVQFSKEFVQLGEEVYKEPQYKIKKVNTDEYLLYRHKQPADKYGIIDSEIYVVTITAKGLYSADAIILEDGRLIIEIEDFILYLNKLSDDVDNSIIHKLSEENTKGDTDIPVNNTSARTGLILGLRYVEKNSRGETEYKYRTLWIGAEDKKLRTIMETQGVFFPRHDGFWRIESNKINTENRMEDVFYAYSVSNGSMEKLNNLNMNDENWKDRTGYIMRSISYICNDYIGIESTGSGAYLSSNKKWRLNTISLQLIDNLPNIKSVKIYDIAGETGVQALNNGRRGILNQLGMGNIKLWDDVPQDENYGLFRTAGHWLFKGRINYESQGINKFSDFNINIIPSSELVFYDDLWIPWTQIKDRVPDALDAYTSPNKDIAVIVTRDRILIYEINSGVLGDLPIKRINLKNSEMVIMAEWAGGSYMEKWEKSFMKNDVKEIK